MAVFFKEATIKFVDINAKINLKKFSSLQKKNFIKFLKTRSFAQTYQGVAELAHRILKKYNVDIMYNKGPYVSLTEENYTPAMKLALETDFAMFILKKDNNMQDTWTSKNIGSVKKAIEENRFPHEALYFMRGHFNSVSKIAKDPLPDDHPVSKLIKQIENSEIEYIDLDWK